MSANYDADALLRQLDAHRDAYLTTFQQMHDLLTQRLALSADASAPAGPQSTQTLNFKSRSLGKEQRTRTSFSVAETRKSSLGLNTIPASTRSRGTGEESSDDDCDHALYVDEALEPQTYDEDMLRKHLMSHNWREAGKQILKGIIDVPTRMTQRDLFPTKRGPADDRSDLAQYQVWDVGPDGAPIPVDAEKDHSLSRALSIWHSVKQINPASKDQQAVGRITIVREPSPILFGAIHFTHNSYFDMDEIFERLVAARGSSAIFDGAFHGDPRRQRSFVFDFEYFTLIGDNCRPMDWQMADLKAKENSYDIRISRCSSVVALSLHGKHIKKVKNCARRAVESHGYVFDPFAPWQVLNLQAFPDLRSSGDVHDSTKHYVNGVEAFLITLLGEFRDALVRFEAIMEEIVRITRPPNDFIFNLEVRDRLQFEDEQYTFTRRYFWAYQTLGTISTSIKAIIDAFEDNFTDDVWEGKHKTIWPIMDETNPRSQYYKTRMDSLRKKVEREMSRFKGLIAEIRDHRREIVGLREELFVGTSIQESRNSVKNTEITIQQGHNIKLLTLVSIFFLPLTFVTSVFGMTNMPEERQYWHFGIVTATVCVPFFILIGSLNTVRGMTFWRKKTSNGVQHLLNFCAWLSSWPRGNTTNAGAAALNRRNSRLSTDHVLDDSTESTTALRLRRWSTNQRAEFEEQKLEAQESRDAIGLDPGAMRPTDAHNRRSSIARLWSAEYKRGVMGQAEV